MHASTGFPRDAVRGARNHSRFSKSGTALFGLITGLYLAARLWRVDVYSLRPDDIFSLRAARLGWVNLTAVIIDDVVHPPLFYLLLKLWIALGGESQIWLRLFPVLTAAAAIFPFFLLCRELRLRPLEINLALMLMAANAYLIYYAQEVRMYSLLLFLSLCSLWIFLRFFNATAGAKKVLLPLSIINFLLVYTQYYGWLVVGTELVFLLMWDRRKVGLFSLSATVLGVCYIPWAYLVVAAATAKGGLESNIGSFQRPGLVTDLVRYYLILTAPLRPLWITFFGVLLLGCSFLFWVWRIYRRSDGKAKNHWVFIDWALLFSFVPPVFSFVVSQFSRQSVWGTRFLIISAVPYILLLAVTLCQLPDRFLRTAAVLFVVSWASVAGFQAVQHANKNAWEPVVHHMMMAEPREATGIIVYTYGSSDEVIAFYLEKARDGRFQTRRIKNIGTIVGKHFWFALRESFEPSPKDIFLKRGYRIGPEYRDGFDGLLFPVWQN